jgi:hypothetical protein
MSVQDDLDAPLVVPARPPRQWFEEIPDWFDPEGSLVQIDFDSGRVAALVAPYGECILDGGQNCWTPPESKTGYEYAHVGTIVTEEGDKVRIANVGGSVPHASLHASASVAQDHYANTATRRMIGRYVDSPENGGIIFVGSMWPGTTQRDALEVMTSALSGDWRYIASLKGYEMVGSQLVNNPGFRPVPRAKTAAAFTIMMVTPRVASAGDLVADQVIGEWVVEDEPVTLNEVADRLAKVANAVAVLMDTDDDEDPWGELDDFDALANSECLTCRGVGCQRCEWVGYFDTAITAAAPKRVAGKVKAVARKAGRKGRDAVGGKGGFFRNVKGIEVWHDPASGEFATPGYVGRQFLRMLRSDRGNSKAKAQQELQRVAQKQYRRDLSVEQFVSKVVGPQPDRADDPDAADGWMDASRMARAIWQRNRAGVPIARGKTRRKFLRERSDTPEVRKLLVPDESQVSAEQRRERLDAARLENPDMPSIPQDDRKFGKPADDKAQDIRLYQRWDYDEASRGWVLSADEPDRRSAEYDEAVADVRARVEALPDVTDPDARADALDELLGDGAGSILTTSAAFNKLGGSGREWTRDRAEKHEQILDRAMEEVRACNMAKDRKSAFLGGLPGAGKSSALKPGGAASKLGIGALELGGGCPDLSGGADGYVSINADLFKSVLAQLHAEDPTAGWLPDTGLRPLEMATFMHDESQHLSALFEARLLDEGYNLVHDGTLHDVGRAQDQIRRLQAAGYDAKPKLLMVDVDAVESAASAEFRYRNDAASELGGRFVPSNVTGAKAGSPTARSRSRDVAEQMIAEGWFGEFSIVNNDGISKGGPKAARATVLYEKIGDGPAVRAVDDRRPRLPNGRLAGQDELDQRVIDAVTAEFGPRPGADAPLEDKDKWQQEWDKKYAEMDAAGELELPWYATGLGILDRLAARRAQRATEAQLGARPAEGSPEAEAWNTAFDQAFREAQKNVGTLGGGTKDNPFKFVVDTTGMSDEAAAVARRQIAEDAAQVLGRTPFHVEIGDDNPDAPEMGAYVPEAIDELFRPYWQQVWDVLNENESFKGMAPDELPPDVRAAVDTKIKDAKMAGEELPFADALKAVGKDRKKAAEAAANAQMDEAGLPAAIDLCRAGIIGAGNPFCGDPDDRRRVRTDMPQAASPVEAAVKGSIARPTGLDEATTTAFDKNMRTPLLDDNGNETGLFAEAPDEDDRVWIVNGDGERTGVYVNSAGWTNADQGLFDFLRSDGQTKVIERDATTGKYVEVDLATGERTTIDFDVDQLEPTQTEIDARKTLKIVSDDIAQDDVYDPIKKLEEQGKLAPGVMIVYKTKDGKYKILDGHHRAMAYKIGKMMGRIGDEDVERQAAFALVDSDSLDDEFVALDMSVVYLTGMGIPTADLEGKPDTEQFAATAKSAGRLSPENLLKMLAEDQRLRDLGTSGFVGRVREILETEALTRDIDGLRALLDANTTRVAAGQLGLDAAFVDRLERQLDARISGEDPFYGMSFGQARGMDGVIDGYGTEAEPFVVTNIESAAEIFARSGYHISFEPPEGEVAGGRRVGWLMDEVMRIAESDDTTDRVIDLSRLTVPDSNITMQMAFNEKTRKTMPQFASPRVTKDGRPALAEGSVAANKPVTFTDGREDWPNVTAEYLAELSQRDVAVVEDTIMSADELMPSQAEINLGKVNEIRQEMLARIAAGEPPVANGDILINQQGYIIDGHHRAMAYLMVANERNLDLDVPVTVVDQDILPTLDDASVFSAMMGIPPADLAGEPDLTFAQTRNSVLRLSTELLERYLSEYRSVMPPAIRSMMEEVLKERKVLDAELEKARVRAWIARTSDFGSFGPRPEDMFN